MKDIEIVDLQDSWVKFGKIFTQSGVSQQYEKLPLGIYHVHYSEMKGWFLENHDSQFHFPYKIYGIENTFIDRVVKTYKNTSGNLGILLNGIKGTGKTVTAELICNAINLPVILIGAEAAQAGGISEFLDSIKQDIIVFIDEYEKTFGESNALLTVMDGVMSKEYRKMFLLTTNNTYLEDNLMQRPSRIRYHKTFSDLPLDIIIEIVDDKLTHKQFRDNIIKYISGLKIITVDIVKSIVEEVNIHKEEPEAFKNIINAKVNDTVFDIFSLPTKKGGKAKQIFKAVKINLRSSEIEEDDEIRLIGKVISVNGTYEASIIGVRDKGEYEIMSYHDSSKKAIWRIEEAWSSHRSFRDYAF